MNENTQGQSTAKKKDIGAAWSRTSKTGQKYWSMKVTLGEQTYSLVAFKNGFKETENQPDIKIYLSEPPPAASQAQGASVKQSRPPFQQQQPSASKGRTKPAPEAFDDFPGAEPQPEPSQDFGSDEDIF